LRMDSQVDLKGNRFRISGLAIFLACVGVALIVLSLAWAYRLTVGRHVDQGVERLDRIVSAFTNSVTLRPELIIDQVTVIGQSTNVFELSTARKELRARFDQEFKYFGSRRIEVEGTYVVNAGFDLNENFKVEVDTKKNKVVATLPRPVVLSVMRRTPLGSRETDSFWNRISKEEREMAYNALDAQAKREARSSGILDDARKFLEDRLKETANSMGMSITFKYVDIEPGKEKERIVVPRD
jgi:hypothetical protein